MLLVLFSTTLLVSCGKYEEGPKISLRSKKARVVEKWTVDGYIVNGVDFSALLTLGSEINITFTKSGNVTLEFIDKLDPENSDMQQGTWEFADGKDALLVTMPDAEPATSEWTITKLKEKEMWFTATEDGELVEYHLKSAE